MDHDDLDSLIADVLGGVQSALETDRRAQAFLADAPVGRNISEVVWELKQGRKSDGKEDDKCQHEQESLSIDSNESFGGTDLQDRSDGTQSPASSTTAVEADLPQKPPPPCEHPSGGIGTTRTSTEFEVRPERARADHTRDEDDADKLEQLEHKIQWQPPSDRRSSESTSTCASSNSDSDLGIPDLCLASINSDGRYDTQTNGMPVNYAENDVDAFKLCMLHIHSLGIVDLQHRTMDTQSLASLTAAAVEANASSSSEGETDVSHTPSPSPRVFHDVQLEWRRLMTRNMPNDFTRQHRRLVEQTGSAWKVRFPLFPVQIHLERKHRPLFPEHGRWQARSLRPSEGYHAGNTFITWATKSFAGPHRLGAATAPKS